MRMRVGLMGFGKTGRAVASVLLESNKVTLQWAIRQSQLLEHRSVPEFLGISSNANDPGFIYMRDEFSATELFDKHPIDILVDFSSTSGIDYYGEEAAKRGIIIISAISQYSSEKIERLQQLAEQTIVMHSPNITLGINFLIIAAKILKNIAPFTDIEVIEEHFKNKPEISGTARIIANKLDLPEDQIKTIRAGGIIGTHEILFGFPYQTVRLKHESISREAFGNGILFAIANLQDKTKGFYNMEDLLLPYFQVTEANNMQTEQKHWWKFWEK